MYEDSSGVNLMTEDRTAVMEYSRPVIKWFGYVTINLYVIIERKEGVAWRGVAVFHTPCRAACHALRSVRCNIVKIVLKMEHTSILRAEKGGRSQLSCSEGRSGANAVTEDRTAVME